MRRRGVSRGFGKGELANFLTACLVWGLGFWVYNGSRRSHAGTLVTYSFMGSTYQFNGL